LPIILATERAPLFPAVEGNFRYIPLVFDNRSFLVADRRTLSIEADRLEPLSVNLLAGVDSADNDVLGATGKWPERAWLLAQESNPCVPQNPSHIFTWSGARWTRVAPGDDDARLIGVCRWGDRHFGLRSEDGAAFVPLDGKGPTPPSFRPASSEAQAKGCRTQLEPSHCVTLSNGDLVVIGALCGVTPERPAIEHFTQGAVQGDTYPLPIPAGETSVRVRTFDSWDNEVYLAGSREAPLRGYVAAFSPNEGVRIIDVPGELASVDKVVASRDGSLWFGAAPVKEGVVDQDPQAGLWRRRTSGEWQRLTLDFRLADDKRSWQLAPSIGLFGTPGDAWFNATYLSGDEKSARTERRHVLSRSQPSPKVLKLGAPKRVDTRPVREVPCGP
jgi:hypothetical protein